MFSLQQDNELVVQIPLISMDLQEPTTIRQNLHVGLDDHDDSLAGTSSRKRDGSKNRQINVYEGGGTDSKKKRMMMHREIEKERRQEMAKLYSSLRSLLPLQFIKGKRSISEHMNQAVNYIKHMEKNIKSLKEKRDELKKMFKGRTSNWVPNTVTVRLCQGGGVEILINSGYHQEFLLSRLMLVLVQQGLTIVNYSCTKVNERLLQTIQSEVITDLTCIHPSVLQQKLSEVVQVP